MTGTYDVIVLGAGPAGASAAIEADRLGLRVLVVDEQEDAGGQFWRMPGPKAARAHAEPDGNDLRARLRASGVTSSFGRRAWFIEPGFRISTIGPDGIEEGTASALILATGAQERHIPVPGWTLPGVFGLAAATVLLKAQGVLPGRRVTVAGVGPLLFLVATAVLKAGGEVAAIVDVNSRRDWLGHSRGLLSRPDLALRGASWLAQVRARRVPVLTRHAVRRILGTNTVEAVEAGPVDAAWTPIRGGARRIECDALCIGFGLIPLTDASRLLGASHRFDPTLGGWVVDVDRDQKTSVQRLYACGDGAGILGAAAAPLRGRIAVLAAARDLGRLPTSSFEVQARPLRAALSRSAHFGAAMTALSAPRPGLTNLISPETTVCRCESVRRAELDAAIAEGAVTINDLKSATRCGMGPCGGKICEEAAAMLIAERTGSAREHIGTATARPPLRPIALDPLLGEFNYDALPIPDLAPL